MHSGTLFDLSRRVRRVALGTLRVRRAPLRLASSRVAQLDGAEGGLDFQECAARLRIAAQAQPHVRHHPVLANALAVVIGDAADDFNYETLNKAFRLCMEGAPLIAIGHNKYFKKSGEFFLDAGPFVEAIEYACDIEAVITGKPSRDFFNQVLTSIGLEAKEVGLIGDDIYGDISGAKSAGMESRLVRTGKYRDGDEQKVSPTATVVGDVLQAVTDLIT